MSKLIKSDQCIEAHPCRLEPIDVDAFFINNEFSSDTAQTDGPASDEATSIPDETETGTDDRAEISILPDGESILPDGESILSDGESVDLSRIAGFAEQLNAFIESNREQAAAGTKEQTAAPPAAIEDFKTVIEQAKREAEQIFAAAKNQAEELNNRAKNETEELTKDAKHQAELLTQNARIQAESILEGAKSKFNELTEGAKLQAGSILESARRQAGDITYSAGRQAEQMINEAKQQAEFITESANRKTAELLKKTQERSEAVIKEAEQKAAGLLEAARQQTEEMLAKANEEAVAIKNQAKQEGFQTGYAEGAAAARQEYEKRLADAYELVARAEEERITRIKSSEAEILKLAAAIAEKIIGAELKTDPNVLVAIVKEALAGIPTAGTLTIKVNPEDYRLIEENLPEFQKVFREPVAVKIQRDHGIGIGNCYIETDHGNVDARIKTQLEMITAEILKVGRSE